MESLTFKDFFDAVIEEKNADQVANINPKNIDHRLAEVAWKAMGKLLVRKGLKIVPNDIH